MYRVFVTFFCDCENTVEKRFTEKSAAETYAAEVTRHGQAFAAIWWRKKLVKVFGSTPNK